MVYLVVVLTLIFPLSYLVYRIQKLLNPKGLQRKVAYFSGRSPD